MANSTGPGITNMARLNICGALLAVMNLLFKHEVTKIIYTNIIQHIDNIIEKLDTFQKRYIYIYVSVPLILCTAISNVTFI